MTQSLEDLFPNQHDRSRFLILAVVACTMLLVEGTSLLCEPDARRTLEGVDEDDVEYDADWSDAASSPDWYSLSKYVDPDSVTYDLIQGFFIIAVVAFTIWSCWCCGIRFGICADPRLDQYRQRRLIRDGRGVFSKLPAHLDAHDDTWDDGSQISMEFGEFHTDEDEYDDGIDMKREEKRLFEEANDYFAEEESQTTPVPVESDIDETTEQEGKDILGLEAIETGEMPQNSNKKPEMVFL